MSETYGYIASHYLLPARYSQDRNPFHQAEPETALDNFARRGHFYRGGRGCRGRKLDFSLIGRQGGELYNKNVRKPRCPKIRGFCRKCEWKKWQRFFSWVFLPRLTPFLIFFGYFLRCYLTIRDFFHRQQDYLRAGWSLQVQLGLPKIGKSGSLGLPDVHFLISWPKRCREPLPLR